MNHPIMFLDRDNKTKLVPAIIKKLIKLFYFRCYCKKLVEKSNKENLKVIKNTLPIKSGNPESIKK